MLTTFALFLFILSTVVVNILHFLPYFSSKCNLTHLAYQAYVFASQGKKIVWLDYIYIYLQASK